ncbi:pseudaminic acid synthase [soil metagenome]
MEISIGNKILGDNHPAFIVAELSANHSQDFDLAVKTVKAAKAAGADAIKLQTYTPDTLTIDCDNKYFQLNNGSLWDGETLYHLYQKAYMPWEWQSKLKKVADSIGLIFFSAPFDTTATDMLEKMNVPAYKVASFELNDIPLVEYIARKGKPIILSTGIATLADITAGVNACHRVGNTQIILLKCTSMYPAPFEEVNLRTMPHMAQTFQTLVGLSDHTLGISVPIAAATLGATVIEKHFILDKNQESPDAAFSLDPQEFKQMVTSVREVEKSLGKITYKVSKNVLKNKKFQRSLFIVKDVKKGEVFTAENIRSIRPGYGLEPKFISTILGKTASKNIKRGTPLSWDSI